MSNNYNQLNWPYFCSLKVKIHIQGIQKMTPRRSKTWNTIFSKCNSRTCPNIPVSVQNTLVPVQIVQKTVQIQMTFLGFLKIYPPSKFNLRFLRMNVKEFFYYLNYIQSYFEKTNFFFKIWSETRPDSTCALLEVCKSGQKPW